MEFNNPSLTIKEITRGNIGREKLMAGINELADTVKSTLGAGGRTVIYQDATGKPMITKDGVTVAEATILWDPIENIGADLVKEAASLTVKEAGDGTTTATVLAQSLMLAANAALLKDPTLTVRELTKGINLGLKKTLDFLAGETVPVTGGILKSVAAISANNDPELGKLISEAYEAAGENGDVLMKDSLDENTYVETVTGMRLESGLKSQYWRTNIEQETAEFEDALVLLLTSPLNNIRKIQNILEFAIKRNRPLLVIGELEQQPMATLLSNKVKGVLKVNVIDLPGFGKTKQDTVDDIAFKTGATPISEALGDDFDFIDVSFLGSVNQVVTDSMRTIIQVDEVEGTAERIEAVREKIKTEENPYIKKKLGERINILAGAVSVINVGAESQLELKEKKDRIEDAMYAVKAAIKEGIVPGGGVALMNASNALNSEGATKGELVLAKAILAPFTTILINADTLLAEPVLKALYSGKGEGVNVISGEIVDMVTEGIIDPVLVTRSALKNAVSVITTIISTDAILSNKINPNQ
tara:strand:- start:2368 stop:3957 length:1590 start_codon:yes stop_codon:yes gene_type:complete